MHTSCLSKCLNEYRIRCSKKWLRGNRRTLEIMLRTEWKDPMERKAFFDLCAAQVLEGNRSGGFFRKERVDVVIKQLSEMGKVVSHLQFKNKWDHLRKYWKIWKQLIERGTRLGYNHDTRRIDATDEWWGRKLKECPQATTTRKKGLLNIASMEIMFEGMVATGKNAWTPSGQILKESTEGFGDSTDSKEFVDSQCQPSVDVDPMEVEGPSLSRTRQEINKGKGLARGVHLFKGIHKKRGNKRSIVQEMSDSLKNISDVIVESRSVSTRTPFASTAAAEFQVVMDMVLSLPGLEPGDHLHMLSSYFFMGNQEARHMFATHSHCKEFQLKWLEKRYQKNPELW